MGKRKNVLSRFFEKIEIKNNCWEWKAHKSQSGYGRFGFNGDVVDAYRFSYELFKGFIPKDKELDHLCRNRACVNPEHLELVTRKENLIRSPLIREHWKNIGKYENGVKFQRNKTHCPKGHLLTLKNLSRYHYNKKGWRICLTCQRERQKNSKKLDRRIRNLLRIELRVI